MISLVRRLVRKKVMKCVLLLFIRAFIYFWLHWVSVALPELSPVEASGDSSSWRPSDFSLQWLSLLRSVGPGRLDFSRCSTGPLGAALGLCSAGSVVGGAWLSCSGHVGSSQIRSWTLHWQRILCHPGSPVLQCFFLLHIHLSDVY